MWQPRVTADLETIWKAVQGLEIIFVENQAVDLEVGFDAGLGNRLGDDGVSMLETPGEENLLDGSAVLFGDASESLIFDQRRVGGAEDGVGGDVNTLFGAELG